MNVMTGLSKNQRKAEARKLYRHVTDLYNAHYGIKINQLVVQRVIWILIKVILIRTIKHGYVHIPSLGVFRLTRGRGKMKTRLDMPVEDQWKKWDHYKAVLHFTWDFRRFYRLFKNGNTTCGVSLKYKHLIRSDKKY